MVNKRYCSTNFFTIASVVWIWFFYDVSNVVNLYTISFDVNISNSLHWSINFLIIDSINNSTHYFKLLINTKSYYTFSLRLGLDLAFTFFSAFSFFSFFFFFFFKSRFCWLFNCKQCIRALFTDPQISLFSHFFIKNGSYGTIYTFKNYFVTVFSVFSFSKINSIQTDP